jgi:Ferritin-like
VPLAAIVSEPRGGLQVIDTHEELLIALAEAAELEHSLICQYLFTAYSIKINPTKDAISTADAEKFRNWRESILTVARQEMGHLGTVWNLTALVGGAAHSERANFPQPSGRHYPPDIDFALTPFNEDTLKRFIAFERPEPPQAALRLLPPDPLIYKRVGDLYRQIRGAVATLPDNQLLIDTDAVEDQGSWSNAVTLKTAVTRQEALDAIDFIIEQGEGSPGSTVGSHFERFRTLLDDLKAHRIAGGTEPARRVVENPISVVHRDAADGTIIRDKIAIRAMASFNLLYRCLVDGLRHYYSAGAESSDQHGNLKTVCFKLMHNCIRPLAELLTQLPAGVENDPQMRTGPSFEFYGDEALSPRPRVVWRLLSSRLRSVRDELNALSGDTAEAGFAKVASAIDSALEFLDADVP